MHGATKKNRQAYAFYATDDSYGAAVCVLVKRLQEIGLRKDVDLVVLHLPLARFLVQTLQRLGVETREVAPLPPTRGRYFRDCLIKLYVLRLTEYERVVYMDADTLPLKNLDHLLELPFSERIAAPQAYWLPQPFVTTLLMVVKPSMDLWNRAERHFATAHANNLFDMDVVNLEFGTELHHLPAENGCLDTEWEDMDVPFRFGDPETSYQRIPLVHFTAMGKPWFHHPHQVEQLCRNAHPNFLDLRNTWWEVRERLIAECPRMSRIAHSALMYRDQKNKLVWLRKLKRRYDAFSDS